MPRVRVIGLDGMCIKCLKKLCEENLTSFLKKMLEDGVTRPLRSVIPPLSGAAWASLAVGRNPGETGVVDFVIPSKRGPTRVDSSIYKGRAFWDQASSHGLRVAVIEYPMLYPAYPINGVILSSWGSTCSYPSGLLRKLERVLEHPYMNLGVKHEGHDIADTLEFALRVMSEKNKASEYLLGLDDWDLFVDVTVQTDWVLHKTWHLIDEGHPLHKAPHDPHVKALFREFWVSLDEHVREVIEGSEVAVILSDHGFGPAWGFFNVASWLRVIGKEKNVYSLMTPRVPYPCGLLYVDSNDCYQSLLKELKELRYRSNMIVKAWSLREIYHGERKHLLPHIVFCVNNWTTPVVWDPENTTVMGKGAYKHQTGTHRLVGIIMVKASHRRTASSLARIGNVTSVAKRLLNILIKNQ